MFLLYYLFYFYKIDVCNGDKLWIERVLRRNTEISFYKKFKRLVEKESTEFLLSFFVKIDYLKSLANLLTQYPFRLTVD